MKTKVLFLFTTLLLFTTIIFIHCSENGTESNTWPEVRAISAEPTSIWFGESSTVSCNGLDPDGTAITYTWSADAGTFADIHASQTTWSCNEEGTFKLKCTVSDGEDERYATVKVTSSAAPPLLAHWTFDTDFSDATGNNNGTAGPSTTITTEEVEVGSGSAKFTAPNEDLSGIITAGSGITMDAASELTIMMWIKTTDLDGGFLIGKTFDGSYEDLTKGMFIDDEQIVRFKFYGIGSKKGETPVCDDVWHHIALTKSGLDLVFYVDGNMDAERTVDDGTDDGESVITIGGASDPEDPAYPGSFEGYMDDVRIYGRILSEAEIQKVIAASTGMLSK